jgi:uncharacterized membrane protein
MYPQLPDVPWLPCMRRDQVRQGGSVIVMAVIFLAGIVILLTAIDIGQLFYARRNLQKVADLSALAGAETLLNTQTFTSTATTCKASDPPALSASNNAQANGFSVTPTKTVATPLVVACGLWDPTGTAAAPSYFSAAPAGTNMNAVQVVVTQNVQSLFGLLTQTISAQAIASIADPYAAFSVGSKLLQINNGVVPGLLSALGINITGTSLVSYNGLANVSVTPSGLLQALGFQIPLHADIGTVTSILQLTTAGCSNGACTLQALLGAMSTVGGQQNLASALGLSVQQLSLAVPLLSGASGQGGLFTLVNAADAQSALTVNLNALTVLNTAIAVANSKHFVTASGALTLSGLNVATWIGMVEPPSIGIGGIGTTAYTAQVRLYVHITGNLLSLNLLSIDLPIIIDVVNGFGTLTNMCTAKDSNGNDLATIAVQAPILSLCVGSINNDSAAGDSATLNTVFSTTNVCQQNLTSYQMINVLNGILKVNTKIAINALTNNSSVTLIKGQTLPTPNNNLQIGTTFSALVAALVGNLLSNGQGSVTNTNLASTLLSFSTFGNSSSNVLTYIQSANTTLQTFIGSLGPAIQSLLSGVLTVSVLGLLNSVGSLVGGLLSTLGSILGNLIGPCGLLFHNSQTCVANSLLGSQGSGAGAVSNVLLTLLGFLVSLLQPILNALGSGLSTLLSNLLGIQLGLVDVTLLDLNCGGDVVRLVY